MNLKPLANLVTSKVGKQILALKKHSPRLMFAAGVVGVVGTVVLASRATLKLDEVLTEANETRERAKTLLEKDVDYTEKSYEHDMRVITVKTALRTVKLYAPSVILGALSIAALTGSHVILSKRNSALTAAYAVLDKGFKEYRRRVVEKYGAIEDAKLMHGHELEERTIVEEDGTTKKIIAAKGDAPHGMSLYARVFDRTNKNFVHGPHKNATFIQCQQNWANQMLQARGVVLLNDVYEMLGFDRTSYGAIVGWVKDGNGDGYIDFGVLKNNDVEGMRFIMGYEDAVWLDFNVDGVVYKELDRL